MGASQSSSESLPGRRRQPRRGSLVDRSSSSGSSYYTGSDNEGSGSGSDDAGSDGRERANERHAPALRARGSDCWGGKGVGGGGGFTSGGSECWGLAARAPPRPPVSPPTYRAAAREASAEARGAKARGSDVGGVDGAATGKRRPLAPLRSEGAGSGEWRQAHAEPSREGRRCSSSSSRSGLIAPVVAVRASGSPPRPGDSTTLASEDGSARGVGSGPAARQRSTTPTAAKGPAFMRRSQLLTSRPTPAPSLVEPMNVPLSSGHLEALEAIEALKSTLQGGASSPHPFLTSQAFEASPQAAADASSQAVEGQSSVAEVAVVPTPQARRPRGSTPVRPY